MSHFLQVLQILGSLGVFFYGMKRMGEAIQRLAGDRLRASLSFVTRNRFKGVFTGFFITTVIQSSSATTVMVVSFVNAGLLTLTESIGVIMGANLGTTVTIWIISIFGFKVSLSAMAIPVIGIGIPFIFSKESKWQNIGEVLVGFGLLFMGLGLLKKAVPDIKNNPEVLQFLADYTNMGYASILLFIIVGIFLTIVVQSSSAAGAVTVAMAYQGWIDFPIAAAIILGENIGTTVTAYMASMGGNTQAKRAARAHLVFNLIGVCWMLVVYFGFIKLVDSIVPGDSAIAENIPIHLSAFHTFFNLANIIMLIAFVPQIAKLVEKLVKEDKKEDEEAVEYHLPYIATAILKTPEMYIFEARKEIIKMATLAHNMFQNFLDVFFNPESDMGASVKKLKKQEDLVDLMKSELTRFLGRISREKLAGKSAVMVTSLMRIVNEIESIADCCYDLILATEKRYDEKIELHPTANQEIRSFADEVIEFILFNLGNLQVANLRDSDIRIAIEHEIKIDDLRDMLRESSVNRISDSGMVKREMLFMEIIKNFERIGDYSLNISEAVKKTFL
ncbi:MAG: Na/Pi cotransporter family protein [Deltaproteobacteria bacterium]|jgi:phosphate:Na+ symporter|nr:Na/Pi cotransporter family protein [Deltaproteobacteria bacterium]MBT6502876.1 Na/Pi cotransporter family protein [Deltaproteobacteria bacterium]MBT7154667.1 Na/Pi cotransporter family protein [Deltaproteobacteria bacterium]MBT7711580.1 Na/Pi cotransporter family protein [Deltaproteobacteria bacterium]MBT7890593.1 Na/Pi cotransporter family protein [Deltaproteobacteria bacterium]